MSNKKMLVLTALLLLGLMGPFFGPVPKYLLANMDIRTATGWQVLLFFVPLGIIMGVLWSWMQKNGRTLGDLGWRQPSTWKAMILGLLVGLFWGALGASSYLMFNPEADLMEVSQLRIVTALAGASIAILEDLITRGFVMNELKRLNHSTWVQVFGSALLFAFYHTAWHFSVASFVFSVVYGLMLSGLFVLGKRSLTPVILGHSVALLVGEPFLTLSMMEALKMVAGG